MTKRLDLFFGETTGLPYERHSDAFTLATFNAAVMGTLLRYDENRNLMPNHLSEFKFNSQDATYELTLRDDLNFHNGRKVTIEDLEFSLLRGFYTKEKNFYSVYLGDIEGLESIKKGTPFASGQVSGVKIIDAQTIKIKLNTVNPYFFHIFTSPYFSIAPREELVDEGFTWKELPVGAGNYRVDTTSHRQDKVVLKRCTNLSATNVPDEVVFHTKKPEHIDISKDAENLESPQISLSENAAGVRLLTVSNLNPLSQNENFRLAINHMIDRENFRNEELGIFPTQFLIPDHQQPPTNTPSLYDPELAKKYFDKIPAELRDKKYKIPVYAGNNFTKKQQFIIEKLEKDFQKIGFKAQFFPNEEKFISRETAEQCPLAFSAILANQVDPLTILSSFQSNSHNEFYTPSKDVLSHYESLYDKASKQVDASERRRYINELVLYAQEQAVAIALTQEKDVLYFNKNTLSDLGLAHTSLYLDIERVRKK